MFRYYVFNHDGDPTELTDRIQQGWALNPGTAGIVMNAEEGTIGIWSVDVEDVTADLTELKGHRLFKVIEDTLTGDDFAGVIGWGYVAERRVNRRPGSNIRTEDRRVWSSSITDINTIFERRILVGKDCERPAETDIERITWLLSTAECALITGDDTYINTDDPVMMDANADSGGYVGQNVRQVFDDCAQQSGKNWFLIPFADGPTLWYDERASASFSSALKISNDKADEDGITTFYPAMVSELTRDPSRVYSGAFGAFDGGYSYVQRSATIEEFAQRDGFTPNPNVKTAAGMKARGLRYLRDNSTEEDTGSTAIIVPRSLANGVVAGHRIQVKFTHWPGYEDFVWVRVLNATKREVNPGLVEIAMELVGDEPEPAGPPTYGILRLAKAGLMYGGGNGGAVWWAQPGDTQPPGYPHQPTVGLIEPIQDLANTPFGSGWSYRGWKVTGTGTVDVTYFCTVVGVIMDSSHDYTITFSLLLNDVAVESTVVVAHIDPPHFGFIYKSATITVSGLDVVPDDEITAYVSCSPGMPFFRAPSGTGQNGERLEITGGSLS